MLRTSTVDGFVLLADRFGEIHKRVTLFTEERGILSAIAHGALKSAGRLKSLTELFLYGRFSLYADPVKESLKITDAECLRSFPGLRTGLRRFYAASLFAEIVLKSFGGGEAGRDLYALFRETFFRLDECPEPDVIHLVLGFIVTFLDLTGFELRGDACEICGRSIGATESAYYVKRIRGFVCPACRREGGVEFSPAARNYYRRARGAAAGDAEDLNLSDRALVGFKNLLYLVLQESLERELSTIATGKGFL
ncbi:MAG: DNA repair protein RecO [Spirochaetales bacterium]|nr:DNA repair protein RecO [Spirochaetales bacterium]